MDEEECDYRTPIGKVIKHINDLCKKPPFDNQLSDAIDLFHEKLSEQEKYLVNGIFKINFAESALFLQSCANLYGKKIDLLWKDLLEYHTRLIRYDCEHQKEKGIPINKEAVDKLEERRNRYLRKKNFKLLQEEEETRVVKPKSRTNDINIDYLICGDRKRVETEERTQTGEEFKSVQMWKDIELETKEQLKIPYPVYRQMIRTYRLKNYPILRSDDFDILDLEDGEFNTKYSRVPGWHHIHHLIEYNNEGLLPDNNNLIAKLKLTVHGRIKFLTNRKLPLDTPFEQYKNEYMEYRNQFFKEEAKKWQNMPLNTFEDFRKQLQLLTDMYGKNKVDRCSVNYTGTHKSNDKIEILDNSDEDSLFELTFSCDKDYTKSDLFVRLEKLSGDIINTKLRQDSGYYECSSGSDSENGESLNGENPVSVNEGNAEAVNEQNANPANVENANAEITETVSEENAEIVNGQNAKPLNGENVENINGEITETASGENAEAVNRENAETVTGENAETVNGANVMESVNSACDDVTNALVNKDDVGNNTDTNKDNNNAPVDINNDVNDANDDDDNSDTRSYISDHDYCLLPPLVEASDNQTNCSKNKAVCDKTVEGIMKKPQSTKVLKAVKNGEPRKKHQLNTELDNEGSPPKRRKLSQKQIEALRQSKITPVNLLKFEKFFSENYQSEEGEGQVPSVEYDPEAVNTDTPHNGDANDCDDRDDTISILSDHSYCQPLPSDSRNDSGFIEPLNLFPQNRDTDNEETNRQTNVEEGISLEEEYERLSALLQENPNAIENQASPPVPPEVDAREKERLDSRERVEQWRSTINPILRNLGGHDFDIHEYESRLIGGMEVNETRPFGDIVQGKSSAEVVRYFISSLQLANTSNIEICGVKQGELSNDTYKIKLLNKDRFHEHLKDYMAPSEESLGEKLERVRAMIAQQGNFGSPKAKHMKLSVKTPKGKIFHDNAKNKPVVKVVKLPNLRFQQREPPEITHSTYQHNKENRSDLTPLFPDNTAKGKAIIKRQVNAQHVLNFDMSLPSTSRHTHWPDVQHDFDGQMPSTSTQNFTPPRNPELFMEEHRRSPRVYAASPNKRRRSESSEESFLDRLVTTQRMNPDIQVHSTPNGPTPCKLAKVSSSSSLKKSFLF